MNPPSVELEFQKKISEKIRIIPEGIDRFRIFTPFRFDDGDHLAIVLKQYNNQWMLSDEAHTFMHLTYDIDEQDLLRGNRQKIISDTLSVFHVEDRDGELIIDIPDQKFGDSLYDFVQALLKITDVSFLTRERVHNTFAEDFRSLFTELIARRAPRLRLARHSARSRRQVCGRLPHQRYAAPDFRARAVERRPN